MSIPEPQPSAPGYLLRIFFKSFPSEFRILGPTSPIKLNHIQEEKKTKQNQTKYLFRLKSKCGVSVQSWNPRKKTDKKPTPLPVSLWKALRPNKRFTRWGKGEMRAGCVKN